MRYWMAVAVMYAIQNRVPSGEFGCRCEAGERGKRLLEKKKYCYLHEDQRSENDPVVDTRNKRGKPTPLKA